MAASGRSRAPESSGIPMLSAISASNRTDDMTGSPHQKPKPTKMATNTGARMVPSPSSAFSTRTEASARVGVKRGGQGPDSRRRQAEACAQAAGSAGQQQPVGQRLTGR